MIILCIFSAPSFAQRGKNGGGIISSANNIVNEYTAVTTDAAIGVTSVTVTNSSLNSNGRFFSSLSAGDLIMIIQMQGATIKVAIDTSYGTVLDYNNCGNYEFCEVASVPNSTTINFNCPLQHDYSASGKVQVIRVPRYDSLTVNNAAGIACDTWNGTNGGIIAMEVLHNTVLNGTGKIDASGKGFRGGILAENLANYGVGDVYWPTGEAGAEKGEGIGGFEIEYDALGGRYCRGAPANGGGGANAHNSGGGGGANGGDINSWTGKGCPDISNTSWIAAWNLEFSGFAGLISSGGGRGGYTFSADNQNALTVGPNNTAWGGDKRDLNGGLGGRPLDYSTGKIFIGGGGGSGDQNDNKGGGGGSGGGLIYILNYGIISGTGQVLANGANGISTSTNNGTDGAGGGGGGGSVFLNSAGTISGISVSADGGNGGIQTLSLFNQEAEGPGAGGGGGYIAISNGAIVRNVNGGANGTTNSFSLTEFPPNGATKGGSGTNNAVISNFLLLANDTTICSGESTTLSVTAAGNVPAGITFGWYDSESGGTLLNTGAVFTTPQLFSSATYYVGSCPGMYRQKVKVSIDSVHVDFSSSSNCLGTITQLTSTSSSVFGSVNSWDWNFDDGSLHSPAQNPSHSFLSAGPFDVQLTVRDNIGCSQSLTHIVIVNALPVINFSTPVLSACGELTAAFSNGTTNGNTYLWNFGDGDTSSQTSPSHIYTSAGTYTVTLSAVSANACIAADSIQNMITVKPKPDASFTVSNACLGDTSQMINLSVGNGSAITNNNWDFGDGTGISSQVQPSYLYLSPGDFPVQLVVTNAVGCVDSSVQILHVSQAPVINFSSIESNGCKPFTVHFTNSTTASTFNWSFGDGSTSSQASPTYIFDSTGTFTVRLTATTGSCSRTDSITNMITVHPKPDAAFTVAAVCINDSAHFINSSSGNGDPITSYNWDYGDASGSSLANPTHHYLSASSFDASLIVTNAGGCSDTASQTVIIHPSPLVDFSADIPSACDSATVTFINTSTGAFTYDWQFGDGAISNSVLPSHLYDSTGVFNVELTATSSYGCSLSHTYLNLVTIHSSPIANFASSETTFCSNHCIDFSNLSSGFPTSYAWTFSGASPSFSSDPNPSSVCYVNQGNYPVTLSVSNGFCTSSHTIGNYIIVKDCSAPVANFICSDTAICSGTCLTFVNMSSNSTSVQWLFQGAIPSFSSDDSPNNICYADSGNYDVKIIATNSNSSDTLLLSQFIHVTNSPAIPIIVRNGDTLSVATGLSYQWYYNGFLLSGENQNKCIAVLPGNYSVVATAVNGCSATSAIYNISTVGIFSEIKEDSFLIFPNPVSDYLTIEFGSGMARPTEIKIENILGELMIEKKNFEAKENVFLIDVSALSSGLYFVSVETTKGKSIVKVFKN